jgi:hypothetical protein
MDKMPPPRQPDSRRRWWFFCMVPQKIPTAGAAWQSTPKRNKPPGLDPDLPRFFHRAGCFGKNQTFPKNRRFGKTPIFYQFEVSEKPL